MEQLARSPISRPSYPLNGNLVEQWLRLMEKFVSLHPWARRARRQPQATLAWPGGEASVSVSGEQKKFVMLARQGIH